MRIFVICILFFSCSGGKQFSDGEYHEQHRPQVHFSPKRMWTNDPNGLVYVNGTYHLFFQHYPDSIKWGPMHWGHAISKDMLRWQEQPIALYPDSLGYIFSGSAVVDSNNTSGLGKDGKVPLVLIFTHHDQPPAKGAKMLQTQSLAYSLDEGKTFVKYPGNPVLPNQGPVNFRDPKVIWHEESRKWVMTLAMGNRIGFYSSPDLKSWKKESEFGERVGAHGGVWECPDLFTLGGNGENIWVLIVSVYPGGPNGGSGTQYFTGKFDGTNFVLSDTTIKWMDYGTDNYAGVTWSNTGSRKIFLGWMSNWFYADKVPTVNWRGAMTLPRELIIKKIREKYYVSSDFIQELENITAEEKFESPAKIDFVNDSLKSFALEFTKDMHEKLIAGYDKDKNQFYIDRSASGKVDFYEKFSSVQWAPRIAEGDSMKISVVLDHSSIEFIADNGITVMTNIFFPSKPYDKAVMDIDIPIKIKRLRSIWK